MSDVNTDDTTTQTEDEKSIIDKAKEAASDIDVQALMGKAKDAAVVVKDRSVDAAVVVKDKVSGFVGENEEKIDDVIHKTGHFVDEKLTRNKFSDKIDKAQEVAKGAVSKVGHGTDGETEAATEAPPAASDEAIEMPPAATDPDQ